jgi:uncharacterized protein (TIGR00269 family)
MKAIERKVLETLDKYRLIRKSDRIAVAVSGGKDSTAVLHILSKHFKAVEAITINAFIGNYSRRNVENITELCSALGIRLHNISFRDEFGHSLCYIQDILKSKGMPMNSCAVCGVLKRYLLNKTARRLKKTLLVTGHTMDDEAQSILMNMLRGQPGMLAKLGPLTGIIQDTKFIPRAKPLYFVTEKETEKYTREMKFPVVYGRCPCALDAYRNTVRNMLDEFEKAHPGTKKRIVTDFLKRLPEIRRGHKQTGSLNYCKSCGEPSAGRVCRACQILTKIRKY